MAKTKLNVVLRKGVSFMCVVAARGGFIGVRLLSEEEIFTSLEGKSQKRATDPHKLRNIRFRKKFQINKITET